MLQPLTTVKHSKFALLLISGLLLATGAASSNHPLSEKFTSNVIYATFEVPEQVESYGYTVEEAQLINSNLIYCRFEQYDTLSECKQGESASFSVERYKSFYNDMRTIIQNLNGGETTIPSENPEKPQILLSGEGQAFDWRRSQVGYASSCNQESGFYAGSTSSPQTDSQRYYYCQEMNPSSYPRESVPNAASFFVWEARQACSSVESIPSDTIRSSLEEYGKLRCPDSQPVSFNQVEPGLYTVGARPGWSFSSNAQDYRNVDKNPANSEITVDDRLQISNPRPGETIEFVVQSGDTRQDFRIVMPTFQLDSTKRIFETGEQTTVNIRSVSTGSNQLSEIKTTKFQTDAFGQKVTNGQSLGGSSLAPSRATLSNPQKTGLIPVKVSLGVNTPGDSLKTSKTQYLFIGEEAKLYQDTAAFSGNKRAVEEHWNVFDSSNPRTSWYSVPDDYPSDQDHDCREKNQQYIENQCDIPNPDISEDDGLLVPETVSLQLKTGGEYRLARFATNVDNLREAYPYPAQDSFVDKGDSANYRYYLDKKSSTQIFRGAPQESFTVYASVRPESGNSNFVLNTTAGNTVEYKIDKSFGQDTRVSSNYRILKIEVGPEQNQNTPESYYMRVSRAYPSSPNSLNTVENKLLNNPPQSYGFEVTEASEESVMHLNWFVESTK